MNVFTNSNKIVGRLSDLLSLHKSLNYNFCELSNVVRDTKIIYIILNNIRLYIGQTNDFSHRTKQHLSLIRSILLSKNNNNSNKNKPNHTKFNVLDVNKNANRLVYKYLSKYNFFILPLLRVKSTDALVIENIIIKQFNHTSLNLPSKFEYNNNNNKNIIYSTNKHKRSKRKRESTTYLSPSKSLQGEGTSRILKVSITLFEIKGVLYHSLLSLLNSYIDVNVDVKMYSYGGLKRSDLKICVYSFGDSIVKYNDTSLSMKDMINILCKKNYDGNNIMFNITPKRTNTWTEMMFLLIKENYNPLRIDYLLNTLNENTLHNLSVFFWIKLFKIVNNFENRSVVIKIRKFLRHYIFHFYKITHKEINNFISLNVSIVFSPFINKTFLTSCHKQIISTFTNDFYFEKFIHYFEKITTNFYFNS